MRNSITGIKVSFACPKLGLILAMSSDSLSTPKSEGDSAIILG